MDLLCLCGAHLDPFLGGWKAWTLVLRPKRAPLARPLTSLCLHFLCDVVMVIILIVRKWSGLYCTVLIRKLAVVSGLKHGWLQGGASIVWVIIHLAWQLAEGREGLCFHLHH